MVTLEPQQTAVDGLRLRVDVRRVVRVTWAVAVVLVVTGLLAAVAAAADVLPWNLTRLFNPDQKLNLPTGFKTTALLATTLLLLLRGAVARRAGEPRATGWRWLAAGAALVLLDETTYLHQSVAEVLADRHPADGILHFAWWLVYLPVAAVAGLLALRFLVGLPSALRLRLLAGGLLYGAGAFAFEPFKSAVASDGGEGTVRFGVVAATSDALQVVGLALLVTTLLADVLARTGSVALERAAGQNRTVANVPTRRNPTRS